MNVLCRLFNASELYDAVILQPQCDYIGLSEESRDNYNSVFLCSQRLHCMYRDLQLHCKSRCPETQLAGFRQVYALSQTLCCGVSSNRKLLQIY